MSAGGAVQEGDLLWTPGPQRIARSHLMAFMNWLERERGLRFSDYEGLWRWSVQELESFWQAIWDYFQVRSSTLPGQVLAERRMPGARWFAGARLNYAEHVLRQARPGADALLFASERTPLTRMSWEELGGQVRTLATQLRRLGIRPGDRIVAYIPNCPEALIAMLAAISIGAIWASCGPEFGTRGVLDRYRQLAPRVLICVDGYQYGGKAFDRRAELQSIIGQLDCLEHVIYLPYLDRSDQRPFATHTLFWNELTAQPQVPATEFNFEQLPFDHPVWILFSSGTTGPPKAICHSHGGMLLEQLKHIAFNFEVPRGGRLFFYTTTGWMMWNVLVSSLLLGIVPVLYDGSASWPDREVLWRLVEESGASLFGTSPTYLAGLQKSGFVPREHFALRALETVTITGSPVSPECMAWVYENVKRDLWVVSGSGGTDVCTGFVTGAVTLPVYAGEIQARSLGVAAYAFNEQGVAVVDEVGELVITEPMPSMPVCFWNDPDNSRYLESYFQYYPGLWRHGDFFRINARGGSYVLGRSDATLNRYGIRIGTAEIYRSLANLPQLEDALIVNLDLPQGRFFMPLFVKLRDGCVLDAATVELIRATLRREYSPRHVPDRIYQVPAIPYTLTGKKMEIPVRRILLGVTLERAANRDAVANPHALDYFCEYARTQTDYSLAAGRLGGG